MPRMTMHEKRSMALSWYSELVEWTKRARADRSWVGKVQPLTRGGLVGNAMELKRWIRLARGMSDPRAMLAQAKREYRV